MGEQGKFEQGQFFDIEELDKMWARMDFDQWRFSGIKIQRTEGRGEGYISQLYWAIGDWLLAGKESAGKKQGGKKWGSMRAVREEAVAIWKKPWGTLKNYMGMSKEFPRKSRRRDNLPWSHHREVWKLPQAEQDKWLDKCVLEKDGHRTRVATLQWLRSEMRQGKTGRLATSEELFKGQVSSFTNRMKLFFPSHGKHLTEEGEFGPGTSAGLLYLFETEQATHGKKKRGDFIFWLIENGLERLGWMPKLKEFAARWNAERKVWQEASARSHAAWKAKMDAQKKLIDGLPKDLNHSEFTNRLRAWEKDYIAQHEASGTKESNRESSLEIAKGRP